MSSKWNFRNSILELIISSQKLKAIFNSGIQVEKIFSKLIIWLLIDIFNWVNPVSNRSRPDLSQESKIIADFVSFSRLIFFFWFIYSDRSWEKKREKRSASAIFGKSQKQSANSKF